MIYSLTLWTRNSNGCLIKRSILSDNIHANNGRIEW